MKILTRTAVELVRVKDGDEIIASIVFHPKEGDFTVETPHTNKWNRQRFASYHDAFFSFIEEALTYELDFPNKEVEIV